MICSMGYLILSLTATTPTKRVTSSEFGNAWSKIRINREGDQQEAGDQVRLTVTGSIWFSKLIAANGQKRRLSPDSFQEWIRDLAGRIREGAKYKDESRFLKKSDFDLIAELGEEYTRHVYSLKTPSQWTITVLGQTVRFSDHVDVPLAFPAYRSDFGVRHFGRPLSSLSNSELNELVKGLPIVESDMKVIMAVSSLEGGFDAVNSFDTGYLSVGCLQFASLANGAGSLGRLMLRYKSRSPDSFWRHFGQFGIDVSPVGQIQVWDPMRRTVLLGSDAAKAFHSNPSFAAIFRVAGQTCSEFRRSQLDQAFHEYFPKEKILRVRFGSDTEVVPVMNIFRSEAGLATLMDHLVKNGNLRLVESVIENFSRKEGVSSVNELAKHEATLVKWSVLRRDFTKDSTLSQP